MQFVNAASDAITISDKPLRLSPLQLQPVSVLSTQMGWVARENKLNGALEIRIPYGGTSLMAQLLSDGRGGLESRWDDRISPQHPAFFPRGDDEVSWLLFALLMRDQFQVR